jgi:L-alanine-DL-glutamate epimerase-like enolase superfamily enzyme
MKITKVWAEAYVCRQPAPMRTGDNSYAEMHFSLVRVATDQGLEGFGLLYASNLPGGAETIRAFVAGLEPLLLGKHPFDTERHYANLYRPSMMGRRSLTTRIVGAVDLALHDIKGKALGQPLWRLLGGFRSAIPAYVAGGYYADGKGLKELAAEMEDHLAFGANGGEDEDRPRLHQGGRRARARGARDRRPRREAHGRQQLGAHACPRRSSSRGASSATSPTWYEDPLGPDNYRGHAELQRTTRIPIATGENEYTRYGFRDLIEHQAAQILCPDAQRMGGVTEFMKACALAQAHDIPIATHGNAEIHAQLACAVPNGLIIEYYRQNSDPTWGYLFDEYLLLKDGQVQLSERPGWGVAINEDWLRRYRVG